MIALRLAHGETENPGFIRELCIALAHRWEPERLFLIFTAYLDEANTDGPKPGMVMAGFLGSGRQWELLSRRLNGLRREYGFKSFHATELKARKHQFKGWSNAKCGRLVEALAGAVRNELTEGVTITLTHQQYMAEYRSTPFPRRMPVLSQFGVCFVTLLDRLLQIVVQQRGKNRLHIVIETGHKNIGAASLIFERKKKELRKQGVELLGTITRATKSESELLMFADFQAHASMLSDRRESIGLPGLTANPIRAPKSGEAGLTLIRYHPGTLNKLKEIWLRQQEAAHQDYLNRRAAWLASQKKDESS
jgi:hypothetical protein